MTLPQAIRLLLTEFLQDFLGYIDTVACVYSPFMQDEIAKWAKVIKAAGIKGE